MTIRLLVSDAAGTAKEELDQCRLLWCEFTLCFSRRRGWSRRTNETCIPCVDSKGFVVRVDYRRCPWAMTKESKWTIGCFQRKRRSEESELTSSVGFYIWSRNERVKRWLPNESDESKLNTRGFHTWQVMLESKWDTTRCMTDSDVGTMTRMLLVSDAVEAAKDKLEQCRQLWCEFTLCCSIRRGWSRRNERASPA